MNYKDIKVNTNHQYNTFTFNGQEIKVLQYLPISEKFDLIMVALQKSLVNGVYNPIRLRTFFKLNIVYLYTDIVFDAEDRADEGGLYDNLYTSGLIAQVEENMDEVERLELYNLMNECETKESAYHTTAAAIIAKLIDDMPKNAEVAKDFVENFDKNKYAEVLNFVKAIQK